MRKNIFLFASVVLLFLSSLARAGWYEVKNYAGTIGAAPVHVSLQTFGFIYHGIAGEWLVDGSYYYDTYRIPIPLQGEQKPDHRMVLCEAMAPRFSAEGPVVLRDKTGRHAARCAITLAIVDDGATGSWIGGKKLLPISLRQVGSLDDTGDASTPLTGVVEIPMWYHTKTQLLLGVYRSSDDCPLSMTELRLVDMATGRVDKEITLHCSAGMAMTGIYSNVSRAPKAHHVTVGFAGGKMGEDRVIDIGQPPLK